MRSIAVLAVLLIVATLDGALARQSLGGFRVREPGVSRISISQVDSKKRFALIIGNRNYEQAGWTLINTINDAKLVANALESVGFLRKNIRIVENADESTLMNALQEYADRLREAGKDGVGVLYYAGHGLQYNGQNYLVPVSAHIERPEQIITQATPLERILSAISEAGNRVNIIILDACRKPLLPSGGRQPPVPGLAREQLTPNSGFLLAYAAAPGHVAYDSPVGEEKNENPDNSPYAIALAHHIKSESNIHVATMFFHIADEVFNSTNKLQTPQINGFIPGADFCFGGCRIEPPPGPKGADYCTRECGALSAQGPLQIVVNPLDKEGKYHTISQALKNIAEGGVIYVMHGVYNESILVNKTVYIQGDRGAGPGVQINAPLNRPCIAFEPKRAEAHAVIANVRLYAKIYSSEACVDIGQGVFTLKESDILGSAVRPAIRISGGTVTLEKNHIASGSEGVFVEQTHSLSQSFIIDNKITMNKVGVDIASGSRSDVFVAGNEIFDNLDSGLKSSGYGGATVVGNSVRNNSGAGITLDKYSRVSIVRYNSIAQNEGDGIAIPFGVNGVIEGNTIVGNRGKAIYIGEGNAPQIQNNLVGGNQDGKQ